jgi:hypothetical protein
MNLNIDHILEHVAPWDFTVTIDGQPYTTRRPSIGELGAMQAIKGREIAEITALLNALFVGEPPPRWELPTLMAFLAGYLEYFTQVTEKKASGGITAEQRAKELVRAALSSGN